MSVLLDTSVLFAFLHADDRHHDEAAGLMKRVSSGELGAPFVADLVVAELFTLIRSRTGDRALEENARRLLPMPEPLLPGLRIVPTAPAHVEAAWKAFERHRGARISFADAAQLALLSAYGIDRLATLDTRLRPLAPAFPD